MTDRLEEIRERLRERATANMPKLTLPLLSVNDAMEVIRAAGVTVPEPPKGPVTSAEAAHTYWTALESSGVVPNRSLVCETRRALDAAMPPLIRDHALLPVAVVEEAIKDAWREWFDGDTRGRYEFVRLVRDKLAALTRREG